jgi:exonuclease 3'-5' domain-containing protein 1
MALDAHTYKTLQRGSTYSLRRQPHDTPLTMSTAKLISTEVDLARVLDQLNVSTTVPPHLYIDLEGINLSRHGSISILTLYDRSQPHVYLVDVYTLGFAAFTTPSATCKTLPSSDMDVIDADSLGMAPHFITLKSILESQNIPKVFFDVRNDSDALFSCFGIRLQGVQDLQVMELASK